MLARARLHRPKRAVAGTEYKRLLAAHRHDGRSAIGRIVGTDAGAVQPAQLAGRLIERHEPMGWPGQAAPFGLIAPTNDDRAYKHGVFKHDWNIGAPAERGDETELLVQAAVPDDLAGVALQ